MIELLLPAGNNASLRAAVNNGADAVYLGLETFGARSLARNFTANNIESIIRYCHEHNVKVYITLNTLIKNHEIEAFLQNIHIVNQAKADAIIIQDIALIPLIRQNFPNIKIHLSTQATITNNASVPKYVDRVILPRELSLEDAKIISQSHNTEMFIHGALCISYSGQCLFSSLAGGRSGNRGRCAQPCRKLYNNKLLLSTLDLCSIENLPEIIQTGTCSLKIEGRMRSPSYVATVARIYRKYIDLYYKNLGQNKRSLNIDTFSVDPKDIETLKQIFSREQTPGYAFTDSITNPKQSIHRGIYIGRVKNQTLTPRYPLQAGDVITLVNNDQLQKIEIDKEIKTMELAPDHEGFLAYKTRSENPEINVGKDILFTPFNPTKKKVKLPVIEEKYPEQVPRIYVKVYNKKGALEADSAKADIIYYDILDKAIKDIKPLLKNSKLFAYTPRIVSDKEIIEITKIIKAISPDGVLVGNPGFLKYLKDIEVHLDYSFNIFNDLDLEYYDKLAIISPELNMEELEQLYNKNFIALIHGNIILMTLKEDIKAPELTDPDNRVFKVRKQHGRAEILNGTHLGLFNKVLELQELGIQHFFIDISKDVKKIVRIYKKILNHEPFDDKKISKGFTIGHLHRGVE